MLADGYSPYDDHSVTIEKDLLDILDGETSNAPGNIPVDTEPPHTEPGATAADPATSEVARLAAAAAHVALPAAAPASSHQDAAAASMPHAEPHDPIDTLDPTILEILGDDPTAKVEYGASVHREIASRFEHFAVTGLDKEVRKELTDKYLVPDNCVRTGAPILNDEIRAALPDTIVRRDKIFQAKQKQLATVISCVASTITEQLSSKEKNHELLKKLMDMGRLLCDIQHTESLARRQFSLSSLKKDMKDHLVNTKIDKNLFGENLQETLKTARAVNKSGSDLKVSSKNIKKSQPQAAKPHTPKNWKHPAPARRQPPPPPPPRSRDTYLREQPASSSKRSAPQQKTTRRR